MVKNTFSTNNVMGDPFDGGVRDFETTAIAIYSVPPAEVTISGNHIHDNTIGIWLTNTVSGLGSNTFEDVTIPVKIEQPN